MTNGQKTALVVLAGAMLLGGIAPSAAHQDMIVKVADDGTLQNLPPQFQPASIVVGKFHQPTGMPQSVILRFGSKMTALAPCLRKLFVIPPAQRMRLTASWYHELSRLPPYLVVSLPQKVDPHGLAEGHSVLFNLQTAAVIEMTRLRLNHRGYLQHRENVDLATICTPAEVRDMAPKDAR